MTERESKTVPMVPLNTTPNSGNSAKQKKPKKNGFFTKHKKAVIGIAIAVALIAAGATAFFILKPSFTKSSSSSSSTVKSTTAKRGSVVTTVVGSGTLGSGSGKDVTEMTRVS